MATTGSETTRQRFAIAIYDPGKSRTLIRNLMALGLSLASGLLIWGGYQLLREGRDVTTLERRFAVEYFLGSQMLWLLSGVVVAAILTIGSVASHAASSP